MTAPDRIIADCGFVPTENAVATFASWDKLTEYVRADLVDPAAIREAWEKAYWRMRSYAVHDNDCKLNKPPRFDGPCSCGLTAALEEALDLIQKGADK